MEPYSGSHDGECSRQDVGETGRGFSVADIARGFMGAARVERMLNRNVPLIPRCATIDIVLIGRRLGMTSYPELPLLSHVLTADTYYRK